MQQSIRIFEDEAEVVCGVVQSLPPPLCAAYDGRLAAERRVVLGPVWGPWAATGRSRPPRGGGRACNGMALEPIQTQP